jgi:uncharacterized protein YbjT (DUF2867 family)
MPGTILAIGASGRFAGLVIPALAKRGASIRAFIRKPEQASMVRKNGAAEIAIGDLQDQRSVDAALVGIEAVFYVAPAFLPNEAEAGKAVVTSAQKAGVRRFVLSSVIHPVLSLPNHAAKAPVEEAIINSGLQFTLLHPAVFFQNFAQAWPRVMDEGVIAQPWSVETRFSRVDYRDVAEVAAISLTEERLLNGTFELAADGVHNLNDVAALLREILGRRITARKIDSQTMINVPAPMKAMFDHYNHHGLLGNSLTLRAILGREPRNLRAYFDELAARGL